MGRLHNSLRKVMRKSSNNAESIRKIYWMDQAGTVISKCSLKCLQTGSNPRTCLNLSRTCLGHLDGSAGCERAHARARARTHTHTHTHTHTIFFIHSSVNGHLGSFHTLAIVDRTAINIGVHVPLRNSTPVSLG